MLRTSLRSTLGLLFVTQVGCGQQKASSSDLHVVVGADEQSAVLEDEAGPVATYHNLLDGIGRLTGNCTAFHVGNGVAVTAAHCVQDVGTRGAQPCQALSISWGYRSRQHAYLVSRCVEVLEHKLSENQDYALLRVDPAPPVALPVALNADPVEDAELTVFGHPNGEPLHWSGMCNAHWSAANGFLEHQCDTKAGNSGSPVFDHSQQKVVGVHKGGEGSWNWATKVSNMPLAAFINDSAQQIDDLVLRQGKNATFGPFQNNEKRLLAAFSTRLGRAVSMQMKFDTEEVYDVIRVMDGSGRAQVFSGVGEISLKELATPVTVVFETDYANPSNSVALTSVTVSP